MSASFDLTGPLPRGVTVLEASAGTGKTYAIAGLAARYVAEGVPLEEILLVTFTRMATGELRERVRERLARVEQGLRRALAEAREGDGHPGDGPEAGARQRGGTPGEDDRVVELLARGPREEVERRRRRLRQALAGFDAATIATTHGFCQEVLTGLGIAGDLEPDTELVEDVDELVIEVVDDLFVRRFLRERPAFSRRQALDIARLAVANPEAPVAPGTGELPKMRVGLAESVRRELEARKRQRAVMSYDDLLTRLERALGSSQGPEIAQRLRERYRVVLIDEFQDTDPVQWRIMQRAFGHPGGTLVLIADPKQAIYAFRGADVFAYLEAARTAGTLATLDINWRSDQVLLDAYDALFRGAHLGHPGIAYRQVRAAPAGTRPGLRGAPSDTPLRIRLVDREAVGTTRQGWASTPPARAHVARDLAADVVGLLSSGAEVRDPERGWQQVCPEHLAVLVPRNHHATLVREALTEAGVPAVTGGAGSVFATDSAGHWLALLEALERPTSVMAAHALALTPFLGWSAERIALAGELEWSALHRRLHEWARLLRTAGTWALLEAVARAESLQERMLGRADGERALTDLRHIAQLLHAAAHEEQLGSAALTGWLRRRIREAERESAEEDRSRRLESDAQAVQVLTIHRSKGLEFPVVLLPFLWDMGRLREGEPVCFHDPGAGNERRLDVALQGRDFHRHRDQSAVEQRGEDLRLAYVALTRARHQVVLWWAGSFDTRHSPLTRLLFARGEGGDVEPFLDSVPDDATARKGFGELAAHAPGRISVEAATLGTPGPWRTRPPARAALDRARFDRSLDSRWRRTSYSAMTAEEHAAAVGAALEAGASAASGEAMIGSEPETAALADEPDVPVPGAAGENPPPELSTVPLAAMPVGVKVGTLIHSVLEETDFAAPDLDAELRRALLVAGSGRAGDLGAQAPAPAPAPAEVIQGLRLAIETPLGTDGVRLRDVERPHRLDELEFELPLAGGEHPHGTVTPALLGGVLADHLPGEDPLRRYGERLRAGELAGSVRGYLTGFLDLVVRLPGGRYLIVDYKTNWLGPPEMPLTTWHYRPSALVAEMERRHYVLQALLYMVALHRFLRWRVRGYDPENQLAGVAYTFLRGMTGADTPQLEGGPCGVFRWSPAPGLIAALSDALEQGVPG